MFSKALKGPNITLEQLAPHHLERLTEAASHDDIWTWAKPVNQDLESFITAYIEAMTKNHQGGDPFAYVVIDNKTKTILGSTRYYEVAPSDKRLCIGFTWYQPSVWGSGINPETKFLLLSQAFEALQWNRVGFHVDTRNDRSISAMTYLGATNEGILRKHKIVQGNYVRDTVMFSITQDDWPMIKATLQKRFE
ncbi:GNAT family N-acetyltransferase [bacterium]|jgi:N-acetyltransferase|nr:GNAT family N-acetyltransferase [bacterium]